MRKPLGLGFAIGCVALVAAQHALSKTGRFHRASDPDLITLERLGAQAKRAMEAFVLRPRLPDPYEAVCLGCMRDRGEASATRYDRAPIRLSSRPEAVAALRRPRPKQSRSVAFLRWTFARKAMRARKRFAHRWHPVGRPIAVVSRPAVTETWEAELRR